MAWTMKLSSLCRYSNEVEIAEIDEAVKNEITGAFSSYRSFPFFIDGNVVSNLSLEDPPDLFDYRFIDMKNDIYNSISNNDDTIRARLSNNARLSSRIVNSISFLHQALAESTNPSLISRRFVLMKEKPDSPTILHVSDSTTVISHVGQGPIWTEIPSIYLGLNIFDLLDKEQRQGERELFDAFKELLLIEERAIETGYSHIDRVKPAVSKKLNLLIDAVLKIRKPPKPVYVEISERRVRKFTARNRQNAYRMLNTSLHGDETSFDFHECINAAGSLERLARWYKKGDDSASLREVVKILVAASGHDLHDIRNRANIALERIFSPKEYDAPLATQFHTVRVGEHHTFRHDLPRNKSGYFVRIYRNRSPEQLTLQKHLDYIDIDLGYDRVEKQYTAAHDFGEQGIYDYLVYRKKIKGFQWLTESCSGRINVIPDVSGELILEIFPDIHGHTRMFWKDRGGNTGLVYNENGEVIRLGRFSDITAHLEYLKNRHHITSIYLLGVQERGSNREDWAPEATSPSPFSPMSLVRIEPSLGGETQLARLVQMAHSLGIKVIVDVIPHLNRGSRELPEECIVSCYDLWGKLVQRASTDGRYGSWNDGKLLNYRMFEVWEWLAESIRTLIEKFDIDGIRFDSAHAVPIMMKKNNYPLTFGKKRPNEEMVKGTIVVNDRMDGHFITTGFYDASCRDRIAVPLHYYLMLAIERKLQEKKKNFFINIAECYWGRERFLTRTGSIPYNSALFKICENITHGKTDVREIYHLYDNYYPRALPPGTELLGIFGNHDERRALNTFGHRGLRAAVSLTSFMSNMIMDFEGNAEGESWKVYMDNIYVNWNQFEYAANHSIENFYEELYSFHRENRGRGYLIWANNNMVAAAMKFTQDGIWIGAFNFSEDNQIANLQFDSTRLPIEDLNYFKVVDPVYSEVTNHYNYFTGKELRASNLQTVVSYTDRIKLLKLEKINDPENHYSHFIHDSFYRLCTWSEPSRVSSNFSFLEIASHMESIDEFAQFFYDWLFPLFWKSDRHSLQFGVKRALFHMSKNGLTNGERLLEIIDRMSVHKREELQELGQYLKQNNKQGPLVFLSAEAEPFSKSGGLANVVYELPRELSAMGEEVYVITPMYRGGDEKLLQKMRNALQKYGVTYTGINVRFKLMENEYEVGVHSGNVDGVTYYLLDHFEFFDGLYWGYTAEEKLKRRISFARACTELIRTFNIEPLFTFTNDAFAGLFSGIVRADPFYGDADNFRNTSFLHIMHNVGWQYFDSYYRHERGFDHFRLFNLPTWRAHEFCDPVHHEKINCMVAGIRFANRVITVSPSYANQIQIASDGLESLLHEVIGINNAIGRDFYKMVLERFNNSGFVRTNYPKFLEITGKNRALRQKIETRYPELLKGPHFAQKIKDADRREIVTRMRNKLLLQTERGFKVDPDSVFFAMIHRIAEQKGFQLLLEASEGIIKHLGYQGIIGGSPAAGDQRGEELSRGLVNLQSYYPKNISVNIGFQDVAIPLLCCDVFLMPSMYEPGGIAQLEAFVCGCLVVARATGGLRDTVQPVRIDGEAVEGNGFLFSDYTPHSLYDAMERCALFFKKADDNMLHKTRCRAQSSVYYWDRSAKRYIDAIYTMKEIIRLPAR
jgi:starch synthase